jgi:hypothetical protein
LFFAAVGSARASATVTIAEFGAHADDGRDATPAVKRALAHCMKVGATSLIFEAGRYDFWPDQAGEHYLFVTNNDEGLRRVAFSLSGGKSLCVDGRGATFIFHGGIIPFVLQGTEGVVLKNFTIDWARPFHSELLIESARDGRHLEVSVPPEYPYLIDRGTLVFVDENKQRVPTGDILAFDPVRKETAFMARDQGRKSGLRAEEIGPRRLRLDETLLGTPGEVLVVTQGHRLYPAIVLSDARDTTVSEVIIHHAGGMGVVAQRSRNITLDRVQVRASGSRVCSLNADATHFANCSGKIVIDHCVFENQMDDAANVHGIYTRVMRRLDERSVEVKLMHPQQWGFDYIIPGSRLEMVHSPSLVTYAQGMVKSTERVNKEYTVVTFEQPLPSDLTVGDVLADVEAQPEVLISHCIIGRNRARGILLGSRGKIVVEENVFHTPGAAILLEGDGRYWYEQAGVRDLTIRRNHFENCNYGVWGKAVIEVGSGIEEKERSGSRYNRNVRIEDNIFTVFDPRLVRAYSVDGLFFRGNRIVGSTVYPAQHAGQPAIDVSASDNTDIEAATP